jgi:hypothetical protein
MNFAQTMRSQGKEPEMAERMILLISALVPIIALPALARYAAPTWNKAKDLAHACDPLPAHTVSRGTGVVSRSGRAAATPTPSTSRGDHLGAIVKSGPHNVIETAEPKTGLLGTPGPHMRRKIWSPTSTTAFPPTTKNRPPQPICA